MARAVTLAAALLLAGCFHARAYAPDRAVATWRASQAAKARGAGPSSATRAEPAAPGAALTAEQVYDLALARSSSLAALTARADAAAAQVDAARQIENPEFRLQSFNLDDAIAGRPGLNVVLRMPVPRPGSVRARVHGAERAAEVQRSETDDARRQLRARIYKLFARMAMLTADLELVAHAAELRAARRDQVGARVEQSVATRLDAALADVAHAEAREESAHLRDELATIRSELAHLGGLDDSAQFQIDPGELQLRDVALDLDALTEQALTARPELRAAQSRVGQAEADVFLARSQAWPWFEWAQIHYRIGPEASTPASWTFGVALNVPLFSLNRGEIKARRAVLRQRELEERAEISDVARDVAEALARVEQTARRVRELEAGLLPRVDAAAREAEAALAAGSLDAVAAGEIAARMVAARRIHTAARLAHREAVIDLEAAIGGPLPGARAPGRTPARPGPGAPR